MISFVSEKVLGELILSVWNEEYLLKILDPLAQVLFNQVLSVHKRFERIEFNSKAKNLVKTLKTIRTAK